MRNKAAEQEVRKVESTEIDPAYLGDVSARMFELQAERVRLEGDGASATELRRIDDQIAPLQAFIDEHAEDYARMEMPREITQTIRVPESLRDQRDLKTELKDLQTRYGLTAEQLETETDPDARAALENGINSLRERIHGLRAEVQWAKEDNEDARRKPSKAKEGVTDVGRGSPEARRAAAESDFEEAELRRAVLVDLRNTYSQALESGELPKAGESLIRGAVQTVEDALDRYGRGDMSAQDFQTRVKDIAKARKMWDRYVTDEIRGDFRKAAKEQGAAIRARMEEERVAAEKARKEEQNEEIRRRLKKVAEKQDAEKAIRTTKKLSAEAQVEVEKNVAMGIALSEAAKQRAEVRARIAEKMGRLKEKVRVSRGADLKEAMANIRNLPPPPTAEETAEARRQMGDVVEAMEAGPDTTVRDEDGEVAPPPDNLPVEPELSLEQQQLARVEAMRSTGAKVVARREDGRVQNATIINIESGRVMVAVDDPDHPGKRTTKNPRYEKFLQWQDETTPAERSQADIYAAATTGMRTSVSESTARIDALRAQVRKIGSEAQAERDRLAGGKIAESATEERFFAQGKNPQELAKRVQATERYPELPPDEAVAADEKIEQMSADTFKNKEDFIKNFIAAADKYPQPFGDPKKFAEKYWTLLQAENKRLNEAMYPPKKTLFGRVKNLFGFGSQTSKVEAENLKEFQALDKIVREVMETPGTSQRGQIFRSTSGRSSATGHIGIGRGGPPR